MTVYQVKRATTLEEVWNWLESHPQACLIAGGTDRIPRINQGLERHDLLIHLSDIPELRGVSEENGFYRIGALTKLVEITEEPLLKDFQALKYAAGRVASPPIRNQGTIGGNLLQENRCMYFNQSVSWRRVEPCFKLGGNRCHQYKGSSRCVALMQSDLAPVLLSRGAGVIFASRRGRREIPLRELYLPAGEKNKQPDEVLVEIRVPKPKTALYSAYVRETIRGSFDFPLVSCAASVELDGRTIQTAAMVIGSAGDAPKFVQHMESLAGRPISNLAAEQEALIEAGRKIVAPFRDSRVNVTVRKAMGEEVMKNVLGQIAAMTEERDQR